MNNGYKILGVDDESINREILLSSLEDRYDVRCVSNGAACLKLAEKWHPDLILMDVKMPGIDGFDTCQQLKQKSELCDIPVIFVSALTSPNERMAGYDAGGVDYIPKPFAPNELMAKIDITLSNKRKIKIAREKTQTVRKTANTAMTTAVEVNGVLRYLQDNIRADSVDDLIGHFFEAISHYDIRGVAEFRYIPEHFTAANTGKVTPLELSLLRKMANKGRMFSFGRRAIYNVSNFSLLVLDLPAADPDKCDRLRDHIDTIVGATNTAINNLKARDKTEARLMDLRVLLATAHDSLLELYTLQQENITEQNTALKSLLDQLLETLGRLELDFDHKNVLLSLITNSEQDAAASYDTGDYLNNRLHSIISLLESAALANADSKTKNARQTVIDLS